MNADADSQSAVAGRHAFRTVLPESRILPVQPTAVQLLGGLREGVRRHGRGMRRLWTREQLVARKQHKPVILRRRDVPSPCQACKQVDDRTWLLRKPLRHGGKSSLYGCNGSAGFVPIGPIRMRRVIELTRHLPFDRSMEKHAQLAPGVFCCFALSLIVSRQIERFTSR
jgi:hypothetical protein